jgi:foldase protein PrsA
MSKEKTNSEKEKKATKKTSTPTKKKTNTKSAKKNDEKIKVEKKKTDTKTKSKDTKKNPKEEKKLDKKISKKEIIEEEIIDDDFDEDLEDFTDDEEIIKEEIIKPKKKEKKNKKEEKTSNENIKKIEKKVKEKNKVKKNGNSSKLKAFGHYLEEHRFVISGFIAGILITVLVVIIIWPDRIATLKDGTQPIVKVGGKTYTADYLYEQMKNKYSVSQLLDSIDSDILTKLYPEDDTMNDEVESTAENYITQYKNYYNYTEEQFLEANGFSSYDDFLDYLKLDYRRKKYLEKYVKDNLTDKEIEEYYNENVYGDIDCQHILIETSSSDDSSSDSSDSSDKLSDEDAKKLAEEIIDKINDGTSWKDIQKEYKDKITFEDLGYQSWDSDLEDTFKDALKDMDNKSYSKEPVKTSYGYHIIYRIKQKKTPTLEKTKDKIIEKLIDEKEEADENLQYKALISLRKEKKITFSDTTMKEKYENYIKEYE